MKRVAIASALVLVTNVARADTEQNNQTTFGVGFTYVPAQNNLGDDIAAVGHYVSYLHELDALYFGVRVALFYGWAPDGASAQQYVFEPDVFVGGRLALGKRFALRLEIGEGPLVDGGEGFATVVTNRTTLRAAAQWTIVKTITLEAVAGPTFVFGTSTAAVFPELGLGAGFRF